MIRTGVSLPDTRGIDKIESISYAHATVEYWFCNDGWPRWTFKLSRDEIVTTMVRQVNASSKGHAHRLALTMYGSSMLASSEIC